MVLVFLCVRPVRGRSGAYRVCVEPALQARLLPTSNVTLVVLVKLCALSGETRERTEGRAFVEKENVTNFSCCYSIIFSMYRYSADYRVSVKRTGKMFSSLV